MVVLGYEVNYAFHLPIHIQCFYGLSILQIFPEKGLVLGKKLVGLLSFQYWKTVPKEKMKNHLNIIEGNRLHLKYVSK